jgi:small subunit ribosomal protein S5
VGVGLGKANEVPEAIRKGNDQARKNIFRVPLDGVTIPHESFGHVGAGKVLLKPASPGTGVIAGGAVRAVVESAGIHDVLSKSLGTSNAHNVVHATVAALKNLKSPDSIANKRGMQTDELARLAAQGRGSTTRAPKKRASMTPAREAAARSKREAAAPQGEGGSREAQAPRRQTGSVIGQTEHQRKVIKGLGLRGPGSQVVVANTPSFRGMVKKVSTSSR